MSERARHVTVYGITHFGPLTAAQQEQFIQLVGKKPLAIEGVGVTPAILTKYQNFVNTNHERDTFDLPIKDQTSLSLVDKYHRLFLLKNNKLYNIDIPSDHEVLQDLLYAWSGESAIVEAILQGTVHNTRDFDLFTDTMLTLVDQEAKAQKRRNLFMVASLLDLYKSDPNLQNLSDLVIVGGGVHVAHLKSELEKKGVAVTALFEKDMYILVGGQIQLGENLHTREEPKVGRLMGARMIVELIFHELLTPTLPDRIRLERRSHTSVGVSEPEFSKEEEQNTDRQIARLVSLMSYEDIRDLCVNSSKLDPARFREYIESKKSVLEKDFI